MYLYLNLFFIYTYLRVGEQVLPMCSNAPHLRINFTSSLWRVSLNIYWVFLHTTCIFFLIFLYLQVAANELQCAAPGNLFHYVSFASLIKYILGLFTWPCIFCLIFLYLQVGAHELKRAAPKNETNFVSLKGLIRYILGLFTYIIGLFWYITGLFTHIKVYVKSPSLKVSLDLYCGSFYIYNTHFKTCFSVCELDPSSSNALHLRSNFTTSLSWGSYAI